MKKQLFIPLFLLAAFTIHISYAQPLRKPKKIRVKGDYIHEATNTVFPEHIGDYERYEVVAFNKPHTDVCGEYRFSTPAGNTKVSIYVYPAGEATESRFRTEYGMSLLAIANAAGQRIHAHQEYVFYKKNGYKVNGYKAYYIAQGNRNVLELYECGNWFFKIRTTSENLDSTGIYAIDKKFMELFDPVSLVKHSSLTDRTFMYIAPACLDDTVLLRCVLASLHRKIDWINTNIDSLERISGFPDLYLDARLEELQTFVHYADTSKSKLSKPHAQRYVGQLKKLIDNGFLDEFVMDKHQMLMIPSNRKFDFEAYDKWIALNPIDINFSVTYSVIAYMTKEAIVAEEKKKSRY